MNADHTFCIARCANAPTCDRSADRLGEHPGDYIVQWVSMADLSAECDWFRPEPEAA